MSAAVKHICLCTSDLNPPSLGHGQGKTGTISSYSLSLGGGMNTRFHFFYWFWDGSKSSGGVGERITFGLQKIRLNSLQMRGESTFNLSVFVQHFIFTSLCFPGGGVNTCFPLYYFWDGSKSSEGVSEQITFRLQKIRLNSLQMRGETTINLSVFVEHLIFTSLHFPGRGIEHSLSLPLLILRLLEVVQGSEWADNFQASENQAKFFADERGIYN